MIHGFFDDSADPKMEDFAVCGGIFADEANSFQLSKRWRKVTKNLREPFRSTNCECQQGQFKSWSKQQCDLLMSELVGILSDPNLRIGVIATSVPIPLYKETFPNSHRDDPYRLAIRHLLVGMARIARKKRDSVKCWFERGSNGGDIAKAFKEVSEYRFRDPLLQMRFSELDFGTKLIPQLQAADLVAREGFKVGANFGERPIRKPLERLWQHAGIVIWSKDYLTRLRDVGEPLSVESLDNMPDDTFMTDVRATPFSVSRRPI